MTNEPERVIGDAAADLVVLEQALAERGTGEVPPDLWLRVRDAAAAASRPKRVDRWRWLAAAALLAGIGLGFALLFSQPTTTGPVTPAARGTHLELGTYQERDFPRASGEPPRDLAELRARLQAADAATASATGLWSDELGQWLHLPRHELDALLRFGLSPDLDADDLATMTTALGAARELGPTSDVVWTHALVVRSGELGTVLRLQLGGPGQPRLAYRSHAGDVELEAPAFPFANLAAEMAELTRRTTDSLGIVVGARGFAAVKASATSLLLVRVPAASTFELRRFEKLTNLRLQESPEWHSVEVLQQLPSSLIDLQLEAAHLQPGALAALSHLDELDELHCVDLWQVMFHGAPLPAAPALDGSAIQSLANLPKLRELSLGGGTFADADLAALQALPLKNLCLVDCPRVHGLGVTALPGLRSIALVGCAPDPMLLPQLAARTLHELSVLRAQSPIHLAALPGVSILYLDGPLASPDLSPLRGCDNLRSLTLRPEPALTLVDAPLFEVLATLPKLRKVSLPNAPDELLANVRRLLPQVDVGNGRW